MDSASSSALCLDAYLSLLRALEASGKNDWVCPSKSSSEEPRPGGCRRAENDLVPYPLCSMQGAEAQLTDVRDLLSINNDTHLVGLCM